MHSPLPANWVCDSCLQPTLRVLSNKPHSSPAGMHATALTASPGTCKLTNCLPGCCRAIRPSSTASVQGPWGPLRQPCTVPMPGQQVQACKHTPHLDNKRTDGRPVGSLGSARGSLLLGQAASDRDSDAPLSEGAAAHSTVPTLTCVSREPVSSLGAALLAGPAWAATRRQVTVFWWLSRRASRRPPPRMSQTHTLVPPAVTARVPAGRQLAGQPPVCVCV